MTEFRRRRSVLYMPGANERALDKARSLKADALILDLEDSVAAEQKMMARNLVSAALDQGGYGDREVVVRVNGLDTPWGLDDMAMAAALRPDAILIPKVSRPADLMRAAELAKGVPLWAMIETPLAILEVSSLGAAAAQTDLNCLIMGTNDLIKETRVRASDARLALVPMLVQAVLAARAYGLDVIDGVYNDFRDEAGFAAECEQGVCLGMDGKTLIHPGQIAVCNARFSASAAEIDWAQKVIAAFNLPENAERGVITVEGKMVERLHLAMARRVIAVSGEPA